MRKGNERGKAEENGTWASAHRDKWGQLTPWKGKGALTPLTKILRTPRKGKEFCAVVIYSSGRSVIKMATSLAPSVKFTVPAFSPLVVRCDRRLALSADIAGTPSPRVSWYLNHTPLNVADDRAEYRLNSDGSGAFGGERQCVENCNK